jgi:chromosome condensin MukBEF MukE localization factor
MMHDAEHYIKKMPRELRTPLQRLRNLEMMLTVVRDISNKRVSYDVAERILAQLKTLDASAQRRGITDPMTMTLAIPLVTPAEVSR